MVEYKAIEWDWNGALNNDLGKTYQTYRWLVDKIKKKGKKPLTLGEFRRDVEPNWPNFLYKQGVRKPEELRRGERFYLGLLKRKPEMVEGVKEILQLCYEGGLVQGIATSGKRMFVEEVLRRNGALKYIDEIVSVEDSFKYKPDPRCWLLLTDRLGVKAEESICVEDMAEGILAARATGIKTTIGVTWGYQRTRRLKEAGPTYIVNNTAQLCNVLFNLLLINLGIKIEKIETEKEILNSKI